MQARRGAHVHHGRLGFVRCREECAAFTDTTEGVLQLLQSANARYIGAVLGNGVRVRRSAPILLFSSSRADDRTCCTEGLDSQCWHLCQC